MRRAIVCVAISFSSFLASSLSAGAITHGTLDGTKHPEVGALIGEFGSPPTKFIDCSGTLIAPDVFLTAGHCTSFLESLGQTTAWVSFDPNVGEPVSGSATLYHGTVVTDPDFIQRSSDHHDLGLVLLDAAIGSITPASLPTSGQLDQVAVKGSTYTAVGYGSEQAQNGPGGKTFPFDGQRRWTVSSFNALTNSWLRLSQNNARGDGGTCLGDSGGPNFIGSGAGETRTIAAITVTGDAPCYSTNVDYRLDTPSARDFLGDYVTLP